MRLTLGPCLLVLSVACQPSEVALPLPTVDPSWASGLVFLQSDVQPSSSVKEVHAFSFAAPGLMRLDVEDVESVRLLTYAEDLAQLNLNAGPLNRPAAGTGRALPPPSSVFSSIVGTEMSWGDESTNTSMELPWELQGIPPRNRCEELVFPSWAIPEFNRIQPYTLVALSPREVLLGGYVSSAEIKVPLETFLGLVRDVGESPQVSFIGPAWPMDQVRSLVAHGSSRVIGTTRGGRVFRVEVGTASVAESASRLPVDRGWKIARGTDGLLIIFDGSHPGALDPNPQTLGAFVVDPLTLELTPFQTPEPFSELEIVNADSMWAAAQGRIYRFDGREWHRDYQVEGGSWITDFAVDDAGTRVVAVVAETFLLERTGDQAWSSLPAIRGSFGINEALFLSTGEIVIGGAAGFYSVYDGSTWCQPESRPFSRDLRALHRAPGTDFVFTMTYSEQESEPLLVARMEFPPVSD